MDICRQNPYADFAYDGVMINPLEVLFVKVKSYQLESDWITSKMAQTYERWQRSKVQLHHILSLSSILIWNANLKMQPLPVDAVRLYEWSGVCETTMCI